MSRPERDQQVQLGALNVLHLGRVVRMTFGDTAVVQGRLLAVRHESGQHGPRTELQVEWWDGHVFTFDHDSDRSATILGRPPEVVSVVEPYRGPMPD